MPATEVDRVSPQEVLGRERRDGDTVSLDINLNGSVLKLEGTVQDSGEIVGTYSVTDSSGSIIDEGSITFEPR